MKKMEWNGETDLRAAEQSKENLEDEYSDGMAARISGKSWPACAMVIKKMLEGTSITVLFMV